MQDKMNPALKQQFDRYKGIPDEKFEVRPLDERVHDQKFETEAVSYFQDAMIRFRKNKSSVVGTWIILIIIVFSILGPLLSSFSISDFDGAYERTRPKIKAFERSGFWDGSQEMTLNNQYLIYEAGIGMAAEDPEGEGGVSWEAGLNSPYTPINEVSEPYEREGKTYYNARIDSYYKTGFRYLTITQEDYEAIEKYEKENDVHILYPMIDRKSKYMSRFSDEDDANNWFRQTANGKPMNRKGKAMDIEEVKEEGLIPNYLLDKQGELAYYAPKSKNMREVRVLYYNYFIYANGHGPEHAFGADGQGYDILTRMASGTRLSLALSICVSFINLTLGALYGAVEGYYGGWVDLLLERIADVLSGIPFFVVTKLFQLHLVQTGKVSVFTGLLFAYCITGWIGTAYMVRTQFYRFKKEEYILAARTLGASDGRLMFKHIFPNAIGTMLTSSVLVIPGTIMSEASLSYLGIVNFNSRYLTSLGTMMSNGQQYLGTDPHILFFPAMLLSLLMISFNLFGNGLRDAFNPSLRGADE